MFLGEFEHSLDAKGRVILPAKHRDQLAEGGFVTKGRGGCLWVLTPEEFDDVASQVREQSKRGAKELNAARAFFGGAAEIQPDRQGRVALPANLREFAGLGRDVVVAGVFSRIEIWDRDRWHELEGAGGAALAESDDLPDFGI
jgi:MraZ protein